MADSADLARLAADMGASAILGRPVGAALVPGVVEVDGVAYRNTWVPPGKLYIQVRCAVCADTGLLPKDSDLSPDEPCDCVYGGAA